jgi:hypothetical protein
MKDIPQEILTELGVSEIRPFVFLHMRIKGTEFHYTDCDIPLYYDGNKYEPYGFRIGNINQTLTNIVDQVDVEIDIVDETLKPFFVGGASPQGSNVGIDVGLLDDDLGIINSTLFNVFSGEIDSWGMDPDEKIVVTLANLFSQWDQVTVNLQSSSCRWKQFKGVECTYSGAETSCDRTYKTCKETYGNQAHFGGDRFLPSIEGKVVWWGGRPKYDD